MDEENENFLQDYEISEDLLYPKQKEKKQKKETKTIFLLNKRRRMKKEPSSVVKWTNELIKLKYKTPEQIDKYFKENGKIISMKERSFYSMLVSSKVKNGNIALSDILTNKPLNGFFYKSGLMTRVISNDDLYLNLLFKKQIDKINDVNIQFIKIGSVKDAIFCSTPFECEGEILKGYYQDFSNQFAAIGLQIGENTASRILGINWGEDIEKKDKDKNEWAEEPQEFTFTFDGYNFTCYGNNNSCIIGPQKTKKDDLLRYSQNMKIISTTGKIVLSEKKIDIKRKVIRFIDTKLKPDSFCPAFLITPKEVNYSVLFTLKFNYNEMFNAVETMSAGKKEVILYDNLFYWSQLEQCFDFIGILGLTSQKLTPDQQTYLENIYNNYIELKDVLILWKQNQLFYQKILLEFYHSFTVKVNFDKLSLIYEKILKYIETRDTLIDDDSYKDIINFVKRCKNFGQMVSNQFDDKVIKLADSIKLILRKLIKQNITDNIVKELRKIGIAIFNIGYNNDGETIKAFPFIVSPGGFLGNLASDVENLNTLKELLENMMKENEKVIAKGEELSDQYYNLMTNIKNFEDIIYENTIENFSKTNNYNLNQNDKNILISIIKEKIGSNQNLQQELFKKIAQSYMANKNVNNIFLSNEQIAAWIQEYVNKEKNKALEKQNEINTLNMEINDKKNKIISKTYKPPSSSTYSYRKTVGGSMSKRKQKNDDDYGSDEETIASTTIEKLKQYAQQQDLSQKGMSRSKYELLPQWYSDIIRLSKLYPDADEKKLQNLPLVKLMGAYPISDSALQLVLYDFKLPNADDILKNGYTPSKKKPAEIGTYADDRTNEKRLRQLRKDGMNLDY